MFTLLILLLNIIGLSTNFIGVVMMFRASPKIQPPSIMLPNEEDLKELSENPHKTKLFRRGMFILSVGFVLQFIALMISATQIPIAEIICK